MTSMHDTKGHGWPGRMPYFKSAPSVAYWEEHWQDFDLSSRLAAFRLGQLGKFEGVFECFLPRDRDVLEAGCGQGQYVLALRNRGFRVMGVDTAAQTLATVRQVYPDLDLRVDDVTALSMSDDALGGYISLGVIEHDESGPQRFLKEAGRVLDDDGVAIFTVPYLNPARALRYPLGRKGDPRGASFYQYYYSRRALAPYLTEAGFEIVHFEPYNALKTLGDDFHLPERMLQRRGFRDYVKGSAGINRLCAHNAIYVCRKLGYRPDRDDLPEVLAPLAVAPRDIVVRRRDEMDAAITAAATDRFARLILTQPESGCLEHLIEAKRKDVSLLAHRTVIAVTSRAATAPDRRVAQITFTLRGTASHATALKMFGTSTQRREILVENLL